MNFDVFAKKVAETICPNETQRAEDAMLQLCDIAESWAKQSETLIKMNLDELGYQKLMQLFFLFELEPMQYFVTRFANANNYTLRAIAKDYILFNQKLKEIVINSQNIKWMFKKTTDSRITLMVTQHEKNVLKGLEKFREKQIDLSTMKEVALNDPKISKLSAQWEYAKKSSLAKTSR